MAVTITPTETDIFTALGNVLDTFGLTTTDPVYSVAIIQGQVNRTPEPPGTDFCVMWPLSRTRLSININTPEPVEITASITGNVMSVTSAQLGAVQVGQMVYGSGITPGCQVLSLISPANSVSPAMWQVSQTANASGEFYLGQNAAMNKTEVMMQIDVHGPSSADNATRIQTLFRSQYGIDAFAAQNAAISPLYTSDPRQIPFDNGEQQVEERWIVDVAMQVNFVINTTEQFANQLIAIVEPSEILAL